MHHTSCNVLLQSQKPFHEISLKVIFTSINYSHFTEYALVTGAKTFNGPCSCNGGGPFVTFREG